MKHIPSILKHLFAFGLIGLGSASAFAENPPITPAWAFRHIVWEDEKNTTQAAEELTRLYLEHQIPVGGIIIDSPWSLSYNDFTWDTDRYPDPAAMIAGFKQKGIRVILWLTGNVNQKCKDTKEQKSSTYDEAVASNFGVNNSKPHDWWKGNGIHIDFTNDKAKEWWYSQLDKVFVDGVSGFKVDQGEVYIGKFLETSKGRMSNEQFRPYYYDAMFDYVRKKSPEGIIIARPYSHQGGYAASVEKMNMGWCGDFGGDWKGLKDQINNIYRSAQRGYGSVGCEVAGFYMQRANKEQFVRYAQFGCMTATMINGGENGAFANHLPWFHGDDVIEIYRRCVSLHHALIPYFFSTVVDAHLHGGSLIQEVSLSEESHRVGQSIFTKAITNAEGKASFHLPSHGTWIDLNGKAYPAGTMVDSVYPLDSFPLFFEAGSVIPLFIENDYAGIGDSSMKGRLTLLIHPNGKTDTVLHIPDGDGVAYTDCAVSFDETTGKLSIRSGKERKYKVILKTDSKPKSVSGAKDWKFDSGTGLVITVDGKDADLTIEK